jgi:hypothetical protein
MYSTRHFTENLGQFHQRCSVYPIGVKHNKEHKLNIVKLLWKVKLFVFLNL